MFGFHTCEKCGDSPERFENYRNQILCPSCFKKEFKKHNKKVQCQKCGKKTYYYTTFYNKTICIKCDMVARQIRSIRYNGNKMIRSIMKDIYELENKRVN